MTRRIRSALLLGVGLFVFPAPANAQDASSNDTAATTAATLVDTDIVVTAERREQRLIDVPQSVSVLSADALRAAHAERFQDYFTRVPSAAIVETQAGQTRLILRGINTGGAGASVATYVDDTPYGSATSLANGAILTPDLDPSDVQRVEVLRGPQGTLYGANSLGGVVKYVTTPPETDAIHASAEGGVESVDHGSTGWSGRAALNLPLGDTVAVRGSGFYRRDPGYIDDPVRGRSINDGKTYGGRISLLAHLTDALTLRGSAVLQDLDSNGTNAVDVDPLTLRPILGRYQQSRIVAEPNAMRYRVYNGTASYDFGSTKLIASTSWGNLDQTQVQDASGAYGPLLTEAFGVPLGAALDQRVTQRRFTQEVRLTGSGTLLDWTLGGFYTREHNLIDQALNGIDTATGAPAEGLSDLALVTIASRYREIAGFASGTLHLAPRFDLTLGGRYSGNKQQAAQTSAGALGDGSANDAASRDDVFTYSVAPSFKPTQDTTLYARIARGYRPGGPNVIPPAAPADVPRSFAPDTTTNYEAGVKAALFDRKLSLELTAFDIEWKNVQLIAAVNDFAVNTNGGGARSRGVEFSATAKPVKGLTIAANGAYVDAALQDDAPALVGGLKGDRLPYTARFASTVSIDYDRPLTDRVNGTAGVSWRYTGARQSAFDTDFGQRRLSPFGQLDAHAGVTVDRVRIDAFVRNLTDSRGIVDVGSAGSARDGAVTTSIIRPRSIGATLGFSY